MSEKDKAGTVVKVVGKSAAPYIIGLGALAAGAYYLSKKDEEISDFFGGIGAGLSEAFSEATEGAGALLTEAPGKAGDTIVNVINEAAEAGAELTKEILAETGEAGKEILSATSELVTFDPKTVKGPKVEAAIKGREEPGKPWSLKKETTEDIRKYVPGPGSIVELQKEVFFPKKVPTGELSEYTPEEQKRTVFEDKQYKGPSLLGWFTRPAGAITGTGPGRPAQTGVYVPGVGIAPTVTLPKTGWSKTKATRSRKAGTSGLYTPTITPSPVKPKYTPEEKLTRFKSDIAAGRSPITGEPIKKKKKEKEKERKAGTDIHGRSPAGRR